MFIVIWSNLWCVILQPLLLVHEEVDVHYCCIAFLLSLSCPSPSNVANELNYGIATPPRCSTPTSIQASDAIPRLSLDPFEIFEHNKQVLKNLVDSDPWELQSNPPMPFAFEGFPDELDPPLSEIVGAFESSSSDNAHVPSYPLALAAAST